MGAITGLIGRRLYVTLPHNWHHGVEVRAFKSLADANESFKAAVRFDVCYQAKRCGEVKHDNGWG